MNFISKLSILAIPYAVIISVCYLWGYWGIFSVDIFSYLTASDIVVLSVVPLLGAGVSSVIGLVLGDFFSRDAPEHVNVSKKSKIIRVIFSIVVVVFFLSQLFFGESNKWLLLPVFLTVSIYFILVKSDLLKEQKSLLKKNEFLICLIIYLPLQALGFGAYKAVDIKSGKEFRYIANAIEGIQITEPEALYYLGKAGTHFFFYNSTNEEIILLNNSHAPILNIKKKSKNVNSDDKKK